ncbi:MAG: hypothetical protein E7047_09110 [Lentisphaerae bacterium]|nr:hypothetical protein [Lentisphaerota bacterium]
MNEQMSNADPMQQPMMQPQMQPMQYQQPMMQQPIMPPQFGQPREGIGAAITSLIFGILLVLSNILSGITRACAVMDNALEDLMYINVGTSFWFMIFMGIAILTGLRALKNTRGRGMAITGITLAVISEYVGGFFYSLMMIS